VTILCSSSTPSCGSRSRRLSPASLGRLSEEAHWNQILSLGPRLDQHLFLWAAAGSEDTELGVKMEPEVGHGETEIYPQVQA
jgi:hypothetical protein